MNESIVRSKGNQNSYKKSEQGWIFVHVEGNSGARGFDYGYLLADEIVNAISDAKKLIEIQTGVPWEFFVQNEASIIHTWKEHLNSDKYFTFYVELLGIADGVRKARPDSNISIDDIILWNGYEELTDYWFPTFA